MNSELFRRFIGSAPGYEKREVIVQKGRAIGYSERPVEPAPQVEEPVMVPVIRYGKVVGWTTL